jgi:hypothetical protein
MCTTAINKTSYPLVKKLAGVKVQQNGGLTRPDDIYDVKVADFIVEIDRAFLSQLTNKEISDMIESGMEICKDQLKSNGLKVLSAHMRSHPPVDEPHSTVSVVADDKLSAIVDNINKITKE